MELSCSLEEGNQHDKELNVNAERCKPSGDSVSANQRSS